MAGVCFNPQYAGRILIPAAVTVCMISKCCVEGKPGGTANKYSSLAD